MSNGYAAAVLADSPVLYYRLDETIGTVIHDATTHGNNGAMVGGVTLARPGAITGDPDTSMLFDGSTGYLTTPIGVNGYTGLTIEMWIKLTTLSLPTTPAIIGSDLVQGTNKGVVMYFSSNGTSIQFVLGNGSSNTVCSHGLLFSTSVWVYIVGSWDGSTMKFYYNAGTPTTASFTGPISTTNTIDIAHNTSGTDFFPSYVDEVAIYNRALTPTQINNHYNAAIAFNAIPHQARKHFGRIQ